MSVATDGAFFDDCRERVRRMEPFAPAGRVHSMVGLSLEAEGLPARVGAVCRIEPEDGGTPVDAEVVGFRDRRLLLMPLGEHAGIGPGAPVRLHRGAGVVRAGEEILGRIVDALGRPLDGRGPLPWSDELPLYGTPAPPLARRRLTRPLDVGVRAINGLLTLAEGSRVGVFAGSGVGKSTLLGQVARHTSADVNVVALVGERGREVREFIERDLGDALERSVVVVATSDQAPLLRVRAAHLAAAYADFFRSRGRRVLMLMDSLSRFCMAQREVGLSSGEPPATRGYPPSVWSGLPRLLERAGTDASGGCITGIYTVLVEGDDPNEPVADAARSMLDGHIVLSREIAERGQFPAIDVLASVSRVMVDVVSEGHVAAAHRAREALATHRRFEDLIAIGAYQEGSDPEVDRARALVATLGGFLAQGRTDAAPLDESLAALEQIVGAGHGKAVHGHAAGVTS